MPSANYNVFRHLAAENAALYRQVLRVFVQAKARFIVHLRPSDLEQAVREADDTAGTAVPESLLQQLVEWGNLESHPDTSEVNSVEDFWRVRNLYQLSTAGEAAEAALEMFDRSVKESGELQAAALDEIRRQLARIASALGSDPAAEDDVADAFDLLWARFDNLTAQAQRFMGGLQRRMELQSLNVESFLTYKQRLIDYLERFLRELVMATHEIAACLLSIDTTALHRLLDRVADRQLQDRLIVTEQERIDQRRDWHGRWNGLAAWFVGGPGRASQAEELRAAARSAIPALVATVAGINERRAGQSDRSADYARLAIWFAEAPDDDAAHRLWRCAFSLNPCRHLSITQETLDQRDASPVESGASWIDAPPMSLSPRLYQSGRYTPRGRTATIIDRSADRARLARLADEEAEALIRARQSLFTDAPVRLSKLPELNDASFRLLIDLIGDALAHRTDATTPVSTFSADGSIRIDLQPTNDNQTAVLRSSDGVLIGDDHLLWIRDAVEAPRFAEQEGVIA